MRSALWWAALMGLAAAGSAQAQAHREDEDHTHAEPEAEQKTGRDHPQGTGERSHTHGDGLHFSHPLIAESISPDTKIRWDQQFFDFPDGDTENSAVLEWEYAFHRGFSIEMGLPYTFSETEFGNFEVLFKFANYAFEEAGVLLGYGVGVEFPTNGTPDEGSEEGEGAGSAIGPTPLHVGPTPPIRAAFSGGGGGGVEGTLGTDEFEVAPFLNFGYQVGDWELVAWLIFGIPFRQEEQEEVATELEYNVSALYRATSRLQLLLELDGSGGISGEAVGEDVLNLAPGLKFAPFAGQPLFLGVSVGFPLTDEEFFDTRVKASLFWHF